MKHLLLTTIAAVVLLGCGGANPTGLESHTGTYTLILNNPFWREGLPVDGKVFAEVDYVLAADSTFYTNNKRGDGKIVGKWSLVGQELVIDGIDEDNVQQGIKVNINTLVKKLPDNAFEVTLDIKTEGKKKDKVSFIAEVSYAGIFTLNKVPAEHEKPLLLIEAPRMLFPFARYILAEVTRDGGYPPLMLNPIDFAALYRKQMEEKQKKN